MSSIYDTPSSSLDEARRLRKGPSTPATIIAWCLLPIACVVAWFVTVIIVVWFSGLVEKYDVLLMGGSEKLFPYSLGLTGVAVVLTAYLVAPSKKLVTAASAYAFGTSICLPILITTYESSDNTFWVAALSAIVCGGCMLGLFYHSNRRSRHRAK